MNTRSTIKMLIFISIFLPQILFASEVDQFTDREKYFNNLLDLTQKLNEYTNKRIALGIENFNTNYNYDELTDEEIHRCVSFEIFKATAGRKSHEYDLQIPQKISLYYAFFKKVGPGPLQKWIKKKENRDYTVKIPKNMYSRKYPELANKNLVIKVSGELIGTDKIDHFFDQGYSYWVKSNYGQSDMQAKQFGFNSELGWYGLKASGIFSFADLCANWRGYLFYKNLFLEEDAFLLINEDKSVSIRRTFYWEDYIDSQLDELINPSLFSKAMERSIGVGFREDKDRFHSTYNEIINMDFWREEPVYNNTYLINDFQSSIPDLPNLKEILKRIDDYM